MKVQELLENQGQGKVVLRTDNIDEYMQTIDKLASQNQRTHYEEISPEGSEELFDIIVEVFDYSYQKETRHDPEAVDIDWDVVYYGTGNHDEESGFYIIEGTMNLPSDVYQNIEQRLIEDQENRYSYDDENRGDYEFEQRRNENL